MTTTDTAELAGRLFVLPEEWADMDRWHAVIGEARRSTPIVSVSIDGFQPFWALTRYADVMAVSRDNDTWHNTTRSVLMANAEWDGMLGAGVPEPMSLVHLDGVEHRDDRQVTNDWFKPAAVRHRQERIDALTDMFMAKMRDLGGECDFARDIAQPFTLRVIMDIYGVPESDEPLMLELTQGLFGAADPEFIGEAATPAEVFVNAAFKFMSYFAAITEDRQKCPTGDLASVIANGQPGGCPMGDIQRLWYYIIVATAGHDTTSFALSGGVEAMLRDPSQLRAVRDDPSLAANAAEETIRWTSPVRHFMRYATRDTEIAGTAIPAGGAALLSYPSANRDETVFEDPDTFDVRRHNADRLAAFGGGAHFCLGSQFARREVRTFLGRMAQELADIEPAGPAEWSQSAFVSGVKHLPMRYSFY
ncbi:cytochrome P450 [Acidiferrimicrobium sp. IK]|uniref:cytochrome P450 n=1 Tax=Acidiferrimicrobium sp. IK TaxID=2871700 RepID=UPI0021CB6CEB|nr:cytochrome P450 [Acidiferrimicrobium sp. IK]MCU4186004.1 cytochrome P450 [Acidiferrimicrobium sp. IK]